MALSLFSEKQEAAKITRNMKHKLKVAVVCGVECL